MNATAPQLHLTEPVKRLGFLVHDVLAHPFCGWCWIVGLDRLGDWVHDHTVFWTNEADEEWPR